MIEITLLTPRQPDWATAVVNQLVEAQKMWLELVTKQNQLVFKTVSEVSGMTNNAPTEALAAWAKQGMEGFIEAQKKWSEIAMAQSSQLMANDGADDVFEAARQAVADNQVRHFAIRAVFVGDCERHRVADLHAGGRVDRFRDEELVRVRNLFDANRRLHHLHADDFVNGFGWSDGAN